MRVEAGRTAAAPLEAEEERRPEREEVQQRLPQEGVSCMAAHGSRQPGRASGPSVPSRTLSPGVYQIGEV